MIQVDPCAEQVLAVIVAKRPGSAARLDVLLRRAFPAQCAVTVAFPALGAEPRAAALLPAVRLILVQGHGVRVAGIALEPVRPGEGLQLGSPADQVAKQEECHAGYGSSILLCAAGKIRVSHTDDGIFHALVLVTRY